MFNPEQSPKPPLEYIENLDQLTPSERLQWLAEFNQRQEKRRQELEVALAQPDLSPEQAQAIDAELEAMMNAALAFSRFFNQRAQDEGNWH